MNKSIYVYLMHVSKRSTFIALHVSFTARGHTRSTL